MSSTNKTLTIELSQYVGTDKPTYLTDYNGDMLKIDNAIAADRDSITTAQGKADGADAKADANATAIQSLDGQINNASNGLTKRVTDVEGDVNTIESLIGNGTPTTSDKTLIGAINELDTIKLDIADLTASAVPVSPITGMSAADVQAALEELAQATPSSTGYQTVASVTADGVKSYATLLAELWSALSSGDLNESSVLVEEGDVYSLVGVSNSNAIFTRCFISSSDSKVNVIDMRLSTTGSRFTASGNTTGSDVSSATVTSGHVLSVKTIK